MKSVRVIILCLLGCISFIFLKLLYDTRKRSLFNYELTGSIEESRRVGAFVAEYSTPTFEYRDSLMDIHFIFRDAYVEHGLEKSTILWGLGGTKWTPIENLYFIAHFSCDSQLDDYFVYGKTDDSPIYYKWSCSNLYYINWRDLRRGCGAIGRSLSISDAKDIPDTLSFVISHGCVYYARQNKYYNEDLCNDTIGVLRFYRL